MKVARCGKSGKKHGISHGKTWISPQIFRFLAARGHVFFPAPRLRKQLAAEIIGLGKPTIIFLLNGGGSAQISKSPLKMVDFGKFPEADVEHMEVS